MSADRDSGSEEGTKNVGLNCGTRAMTTRRSRSEKKRKKEKEKKDTQL